jgi:hypothetical protein
MAVENATSISELDLNSFTGASLGSETDDQVNLLKSVLKDQFPGLGGDGFAKAIVAIEDELNYLQGATGPIQPQLEVAIGQRIPIVTAAVPGNIAIWVAGGVVADSGVSLQALIARLDALES